MSLADVIGGGTSSLDKTRREVSNTRKRLNYVGYGQEADPLTSQSLLTRVLDVLGRFEAGAGGAVSELIAPGLSSTPQFDPFSAFVRGFKKEERITPRDIAVYHGASEEPLFNLKLFDRINISPSPAGILGTLGSVLNPLDPINWLTFGVGGAAGRGAARGSELVGRAFGDDVGRGIVDTLGDATLKGLRGADVGELAGNLITKGQEAVQLGNLAPDAYENLRALLEEQVTKLGAKKKLPTEDLALRLGIQLPYTNTKLAEVAVPGSRPIITSASKLGTKFMETPLGQSLGRAFDTGFVSSKPTNNIMRMLDEGGFENLTAGEAGKNLRGILTDMEDTVRNDLEQNIKAIRTDFDGIPEARRKVLTRELSAEGRFTPLFDRLGRVEAVDAIKALGFTDQEALAALRFHNLRREMERWYTQEGIRDKWLPSWVPNMFVRPPSRTEQGVLRLKYGSAVDQLMPHPEAGSFTEELFKAAAEKNPFLKDRVVTTGALSPQEVNQYLTSKGLKPLLEDDLYNIVTTAQEKFIRSQQAVDAIKMLRNEFGMDAQRLKAAGKGFVPEGYGLYRTEIDANTGRLTLKPATKDEEAGFLGSLVGKKETTQPSDVFALPTEMARVWEDYMKLHMNPVERNAFLRFIDKATSQFRTLSYMVTPGHIPRDFVSNMYNLWLMGMRNATGLPESFKLAAVLDKHIILPTSKGLPDLPGKGWVYVNKGLQKATSAKGSVAIVEEKALRSVQQTLGRGLTVNGKTVRYFDIVRAASKHGVVDTGWWSLEGPKTGALQLEPNKAKQWLRLDPQKNAYTMGMVATTKRVDNASRLLGFMDNLKKGDDFKSAAAKVKTYLFDYGDLTSFEKTWMRRIFPFYTWMRKNIPLQVKEAFKQPGKLATVGKYHRAIGQEQNPDETPGFLEESAAMLLPGGDQFLTSPLPYQDLSKIPLDLNTMSEQLSNVNPLFRTLIELALNKKFFGGMPIENYSGERAEGILGEMGMEKRGPAYLLENIPLYRNVATMSPQTPDLGVLGELLAKVGIDTSGEEMSDEEGRRLAKVLSFMFGPQLFSGERGKEIATYEERDRLRALVRLLQDAGIDVPAVKDIR